MRCAARWRERFCLLSLLDVHSLSYSSPFRDGAVVCLGEQLHGAIVDRVGVEGQELEDLFLLFDPPHLKGQAVGGTVRQESSGEGKRSGAGEAPDSTKIRAARLLR